MRICIAAFCLIATLIMLIITFKLKEKGDEPFVIGVLCLAVLDVACSLLTIIDDCMEVEYPSSEYTLKLKTTTVDEKTDTTYVITKIK